MSNINNQEPTLQKLQLDDSDTYHSYSIYNEITNLILKGNKNFENTNIDV